MKVIWGKTPAIMEPIIDRMKSTKSSMVDIELDLKSQIKRNYYENSSVKKFKDYLSSLKIVESGSIWLREKTLRLKELREIEKVCFSIIIYHLVVCRVFRQGVYNNSILTWVSCNMHFSAWVQLKRAELRVTYYIELERGSKLFKDLNKFEFICHITTFCILTSLKCVLNDLCTSGRAFEN